LHLPAKKSFENLPEKRKIKKLRFFLLFAGF